MSGRRLHIAYVCADRGIPIGGYKGASAHVAELTRALVARGADVHIVAARVHDGLTTEELPATTIDLNARRAVRQSRSTLYAAARTKRERNEAAELLALISNQELARTLERLHKTWRIDAVYERYSLWSHAAADFARGARLPYLLEVNAPLADEQRRYRTLANRAAAETLERYLLSSADKVLVPSAALEPYVIEHGAGAASVHVVPNAADPSRFRPASRSIEPRSRNGGDFVVGFAGSLKPWHGVDRLIQAFRRLHRRSSAYRLLIVGDGPLRGELERAVGTNGLRPKVTFTGAVEIDEVATLLTQMDVAVAPYPKIPGFYFSPIKVFEYMAAGVPIVASDIGQIGDVLEHRRTALLHRPGVVGELAAEIEEIRSKPALGTRLAREARSLLCRRYTWQRNADRVIAMMRTARRRKLAAR